MTDKIAVASPTLPIEGAMRLARRQRAALVVARVGRGWGGVSLGTLERARALGLDCLPVRIALWRMPAVAPDTAEIAVRRRLGPGRPFLLVVDRERPVGAATCAGTLARGLPFAAGELVARLPARVQRVLRDAGRAGERRGWAVAVVGGVVRDLLLGRTEPPRVDLDLVVEGDARALARELAVGRGGDARERVREYPTFLTATVDLPEGMRVDVTTARRERYRAPGVLPEVEPASIEDDLWRRDFSLNALAVRIHGGAWGQGLDPTGGLEDLRRRRIRILHPLSFVEDPTRLFRAIRYAVRLGGWLDPATRELFAEAVRLAVYDALSGDRLRAELKLIRREPVPAAVLVALGRRGAFRLLLRDYRVGGDTGDLLRAVDARCAEVPLADETREGLHVLALTAHLRDEAARAWVERLGWPPALRAGFRRARAETTALLAVLRETGPGAAYRILRDIPELTAAWALVGADDPRARRHLAEHLRRWRTVRPLLTGDDLRAFGLVPGPPFRHLLDNLVAAQVAGHVPDRAAAIRWVRQAVASTDEAEARHPANGTDPGMRGG